MPTVTPHDVTPPRCSGCGRAVPPVGDRSCRCTNALRRFPVGAPVVFHHGGVGAARRTSHGRVVAARIADDAGAQVAVEWDGGSPADGLWLDVAFLDVGHAAADPGATVH